MDDTRRRNQQFNSTHVEHPYHEAVKNYFRPETPVPSVLHSAGDVHALETLKPTCKQINGRYEIGLIWKTDDIQLPESYDNAFKQLIC